MWSLNIYCEWTNGILFLSAWKLPWPRVRSACLVISPFPSLLFQRECKVEANLRLESTSKDWHWIFLQRLFLKLCCSAVLSMPDSSLACFAALWQFTKTQALSTANWHNTLKQRVNKHGNRLLASGHKCRNGEVLKFVCI